MKFQIINHGIEHSQYFQGCGILFTGYNECFTGCGISPKEAFEDAFSQLIEYEEISDDIAAQIEAFEGSQAILQMEEIPQEIAEQPEDGELYCYVSIRVKLGNV